MGNAQLHVDAQFFGCGAIVDQLLLGIGRVLAIDPDIVVDAGLPDIGQLIFIGFYRAAQSN